VDTPNPNDVLCGRGGNINSHRGNEQFRSFVEKRKRVYLTARFKREKRLIASSIVNEIRDMDPPGRFLARKGSMKNISGYWYDIGDEKARDKTSQALRENAPSIRAEIETEINQQRAEMRRQDTVVVDQQPSSSSKTAANDSSYPPPPPPLGHHHANGHGGPIHQHGQGQQQHIHPPPPPPSHLGHSYNPAHQSHYTQQYYDYYYHYYGYSAPPPPPPPGYTSSGAPAPAGAAPPAPPAGYPPPAPPPSYWAAAAGQSNPNGVNVNPNTNSAPPVTTSAAAPSAATASSPTSATASKIITSDTNSAAVSQHAAHANVHAAHNGHPSSMSMQKQEEEDRRFALSLQQEENAKMFEDRNRRFGSDRRSSRSTAYCAPGYRPRLLNDSIDATNGNIGASSSRKKRPAMSASHFFGPPVIKDICVLNPITYTGRNTDTNMGDHYEMNLKPAALSMKQEGNNAKSNGGMIDGLDHTDNSNHHRDFSCSSFSARSRSQFKDDSEVMSLFGEGDTIIPASNANSTGSFNRVRNTFGAASPNALDQGERNLRRYERSQQRDGARRDHNHKDQQQNHQDPSLLSQVANHILRNFGGSSWTESDAGGNDRNPSHHHGETVEPETEMELGQEVIMDVRDESSTMPPPNTRGTGTQIDWASKAGCHSWIPDAIGYNNNAPSVHFGHHENVRDQHGNHNSTHHHANDHSLTRQTSYSRADISPINSMDMDFSRSSIHGGRQRASSGNGGETGGGHNSSSLMNVFDQKNEDPNPEELLPQIYRSVLQQVPSWEQSTRSRSSVSLGDMSGMNGMDDSLMRVNSNIVKDKLFGIVGKNTVQAPPLSLEHQDGHQPRHQNGNHHVHEGHHHDQEQFSSRPQNFNPSRGMDMDWD